MDNKRLDEAVEVAAKALFEDQCPEDCWSAPMDEHERQSWRDGARKVLLAGMKVLLGEPVGWMRTDVTYRGIDGRREGERILSERRVYANDTPIYAPSLGEGDGR